MGRITPRTQFAVILFDIVCHLPDTRRYGIADDNVIWKRGNMMHASQVKEKILEKDWIHSAHQLRSRAKRDQLLKAGEEVFSEFGYDAAHVRDIARRAGVSVGAFYRRFKDKEALFLALQQETIAWMKDGIDRFFSNPKCATLPVEEVIEKFIINSARALEKKQGFYRAQNSSQHLNMNAREAWFEAENYLGQRVLDFLARRGVAIDSKDPYFAAGFGPLVVNSFMLWMLLSHHIPGNERYERYASELNLMLKRYWNFKKVGKS
jgi:AcrR family transcriptional regulator